MCWEEFVSPCNYNVVIVVVWQGPPRGITRSRYHTDVPTHVLCKHEYDCRINNSIYVGYIGNPLKSAFVVPIFRVVVQPRLQREMDNEVAVQQMYKAL